MRQATRIWSGLKAFAPNERGATMIEYGLITALISVAIIGVTFMIGDRIKSVLFAAIASAI
jgi:Flp pilus assembly pilin Flp